jgi:hypothetical protein
MKSENRVPNKTRKAIFSKMAKKELKIVIQREKEILGLKRRSLGLDW